MSVADLTKSFSVGQRRGRPMRGSHHLRIEVFREESKILNKKASRH
jgi:hypothetical protein